MDYGWKYVCLTIGDVRKTRKKRVLGEPGRKCKKKEEESREKRGKKRRWLKAKSEKRREEEGKIKDEWREKEK